jgi:hypothetical protein
VLVLLATVGDPRKAAAVEIVDVTLYTPERLDTIIELSDTNVPAAGDHVAKPVKPFVRTYPGPAGVADTTDAVVEILELFVTNVETLDPDVPLINVIRFELVAGSDMVVTKVERLDPDVPLINVIRFELVAGFDMVVTKVER